MKCSFSMAPIPLNILPINLVSATTPAANILDSKPFLNVPSFGMCTSPANPAVIASFGAPAPCLPSIPAPWIVGVPHVLIANMPVLNEQFKSTCVFGGVIGINFAGQPFVDVG